MLSWCPWEGPTTAAPSASASASHFRGGLGAAKKVRTGSGSASKNLPLLASVSLPLQLSSGEVVACRREVQVLLDTREAQWNGGPGIFFFYSHSIPFLFKFQTAGQFLLHYLSRVLKHFKTIIFSSCIDCLAGKIFSRLKQIQGCYTFL